MRQKKAFISHLTIVFLLLSPYAYPQENPLHDRSQEDASVIEKKVRKEMQAMIKEKREVPEIITEERPKEPAAEGQIRFPVSRVILEGNTRISSEDLVPLIRPYENQERMLSELKELAQAIEKEYRRRGFIATTAYVPPQKIEEGRVRIRIVEGKIGDERVEGNRFFRKKKTLSYSTLKKGEILTYQDLLATVRRMNQNPDREVQALLEAGKEPETTDILFKTKERLPLHFSSSLDNQGSDNSGEERIGLTLRCNNFSSLDDILQVGTVFGSHFGTLFTQHVLPFPFLDSRLATGFSHAQSSPKKDLKSVSINGTSQSYFTRLSKELWATDRTTLTLDTGFEFKESRTKLLAGTFRRERFPIVRATPTLAVADRWGQTRIENDFTWGLDIFGATSFADPDASRQDVRPNFFRYLATVTRTQSLPFGMRALGTAEFQIPSSKLPSSEALSLGGAASVRGYPEGDYLADFGARASFEVLAPAVFIPKAWTVPFSEEPLAKKIDLVCFIDQGYGKLRGPSDTETKQRYLLGIGGGIRIQIYQRIFARTEWAYAMGEEPLSEADHLRYHFRLQVEI